MEEKQLSQAEAQQRVEQIHAFQQEVMTLEQEGIVAIAPEQRDAVQSYHHSLLDKFSSIYDIDTNLRAKQLTLGMKIASLLGALAMAISLFFLFYQFWGYLSTAIQVAILITAPVSLFLLSLHLAQKEKSAYFSKIAALVSLSCFVLNLGMLGQIFNISPSPNAFLVWAAFAFFIGLCLQRSVIVIFCYCQHQ
ncbi:DUF2157 domain-containing protein [Litorilituus sediminis]|uniref:DUF2157 domain-containing protein n=1 Tax=Litorilituus sediminis TaxID=718192 RepID=UPI001FE94BAC|nr:DUF2157 domain-containing protein [Litorilituus sediminis]